MKIQSGYFGEIDIDDGIIIDFDTAIPGFESLHKFFLITEGEDGEAQTPSEDVLFCWLHSVEDPEVAFALLDVYKIMDSYKPEVDEEYLNQIDFAEGDLLSVYNIVNIPEDINEMTVNLIAPIVINNSKKKGAQVVLNNEGYILKHKIFEEVRKKSKEECANKEE